MKRLLVAAACLVLIVGAAGAQTPEQKKATVAYLQALQASDGGFLPAAPKKDDKQAPTSSIRATSSALRALKYFGGEPKDYPASAQFVHSCYDRASGGFAEQPGGKDEVAVTAVGLLAAVEAKLPTDTYARTVVKYLSEKAKTFEEIRIAAAALEALNQRPPQADAWIEQIVKTANPDGTFGKGDGAARETGGAVVALLRLGYKLPNADAVLKTLKAGQRKDGGFGKDGVAGSDLETTYRVMRAFTMLKEKPADTDGLHAFIAKCRNDDGGYGVAPGQPSSASGTYFAAIVLHWLAER